MMVDALAPILDALEPADWPLFRPASDTRYRSEEMESGQQREFLVQDPDGHLLRLAQWLGIRPARQAAPPRQLWCHSPAMVGYDGL